MEFPLVKVYETGFRVTGFSRCLLKTHRRDAGERKAAQEEQKQEWRNARETSSVFLLLFFLRFSALPCVSAVGFSTGSGSCL